MAKTYRVTLQNNRYRIQISDKDSSLCVKLTDHLHALSRKFGGNAGYEDNGSVFFSFKSKENAFGFIRTCLNENES